MIAAAAGGQLGSNRSPFMGREQENETPHRDLRGSVGTALRGLQPKGNPND